MKSNQSTHIQRGVSALEFTIIAPLVFVLVYGLIEFGCFFYDKAMLSNACREGARAGVVFVPHQTLDDIETRVTETINYYLGDYLGVNPSPWPKLICFGPSTPNPGPPNVTIPTGTNKLRVVVSWDYDFLVLPHFEPLGWGSLANPFHLTAVSEMMLEENPAAS